MGSESELTRKLFSFSSLAVYFFSYFGSRAIDLRRQNVTLDGCAAELGSNEGGKTFKNLLILLEISFRTSNAKIVEIDLICLMKRTIDQTCCETLHGNSSRKI